MTVPLPVQFAWDGECMAPASPYWAKEADKQYVVGGRYKLVEHLDRSEASHGHYFASLTEGWKNLRDDQAERFPSVEALRKFSLIKTGFRDEKSIVCASKAEALRFAAFIRPMDEFAVVIVMECTVTVYTAKSQSKKAMGAKTFQASKTAVLDYVAGLIGVTTKELNDSEAA